MGVDERKQQYGRHQWRPAWSVWHVGHACRREHSRGPFFCCKLDRQQRPSLAFWRRWLRCQRQYQLSQRSLGISASYSHAGSDADILARGRNLHLCADGDHQRYDVWGDHLLHHQRDQPTASSTAYSGPITVSSTETLEAIATASGYSTSAVASATYTINLPAAATPTFSLAAGTYTSAQTVTISDTTSGATIYYTTNGTTPTTSSTQYTGAIAVSSTETIEAIAIASGYSSSAVASATYTINIPANPAPVMSGISPAFTSAGGAAFTLTVTGSGFVSGSTVYWGTSALTQRTALRPNSRRKFQQPTLPPGELPPQLQCKRQLQAVALPTHSSLR